MIIRFKLSALQETRWYEYAIRFALGGAVTVSAGILAAIYGPVVGGLFLAFPSIFPASATLIEKHARARKEKVGLKGSRRGKEAAALDASGAIAGSLGLVAFGLIVWAGTTVAGAWIVAWATMAWVYVSLLAWLARRRI
jgi:hypothetical protein